MTHQSLQASLPHSTVPPSGKQGVIEDGFSWLRLGPIFLALVIGLQFMIWTWRTWWKRASDPKVMDNLVAEAQRFFRPDYDLRIYVGGLFATLVLAAIVDLLWQRRLRTLTEGESKRGTHLNLLTHFFVACALMFIPLLWPYSAAVNLLCGVFGSMFCAAALRFKSAASPALWRPMSRMAVVLPLAEFVAVVGIVIVLVYVPDTSQLTSESYVNDFHFHHVDFYIMGPTLAFRHGSALGTDFYAQYGVGWPMITSFFAQFVPLSYKLCFRVLVTAGCVYYIALYYFLRLLLRSVPWAVTGLFLALLLELIGYCGPLSRWIAPNWAICRYFMDVFLFAALLFHARSGKAWLGLAAGTFAAAALLIATDTGVYLTVCLGIYMLVAKRLRRADTTPMPVATFAALAVSSFIVVLLTGLAIASRGTLLRGEFWIGWTESLWAYADGFSHLPVGPVMADRGYYFLFSTALFSYLFATGRAIRGYFIGRLDPNELVVGIVALDGFGTLLLFIGRSDPGYIYNVSIPLCIVLCSFADEIHRALGRLAIRAGSAEAGMLSRMALRFVPWACAGLPLLAIGSSQDFMQYPNALRWLHKGRLQAAATSDDNYLFASSHDGPLPDSRRDDIARFRAITKTMRELADGGSKTVAVIDQCDTHYLVEADMKPYFRYSPVIANLVWKKQINLFGQQLVDHPPDYLLICSEPPMTIIHVRAEEVYRILMKIVKQRFVLDRQIDGMDIYRRRDNRAVSREK